MKRTFPPVSSSTSRRLRVSVHAARARVSAAASDEAALSNWVTASQSADLLRSWLSDNTLQHTRSEDTWVTTAHCTTVNQLIDSSSYSKLMNGTSHKHQHTVGHSVGRQVSDTSIPQTPLEDTWVSTAHLQTSLGRKERWGQCSIAGFMMIMIKITPTTIIITTTIKITTIILLITIILTRTLARRFFWNTAVFTRSLYSYRPVLYSSDSFHSCISIRI